MARKWKPYASIFDKGAWLSVSNMLPHVSGAYVTPTLYTEKTGAGPATPGTTLRAWCALLPSDTAIGYVGTSTKLYEYPTTDRSKVGGYAATDWSFAQYGNITIAASRPDALQARDATTANLFADVAGSPPKASIVVTQAEQVLLFDLNDGAEKPDAFAACAPGDYTDWSGAGATTATRIRHRPGKLTAAVAFNDYVLAFKKSSVYKLTYTGSTFKWRAELIAVGRGAWGKHSVVNCGDVVVFQGPGGAWLFDGASFKDISEQFGDPVSAACVASFYSAPSRRAYFYSGDGVNNTYVYNIASDAWGHQTHNLTTSGSTASHRPFTGEHAALRSFESFPTEVPSLRMPWIVNFSHASSVLEADTLWGGGVSATNGILRGTAEGPGMGAQSTFTRLRLAFSPSYEEFEYNTDTAPIFPAATELDLTCYSIASPLAVGATPVSALASSSSERRFDFLVSAGHIIPQIEIPPDAGHCSILDYVLDYVPAGDII
jgi:hypothetical protein